MEFFFPNRREPLSRGRLAEAAEAHGTGLVSVTFDKPSGMIDDNLQSQLWKTQYALQKKLDEHSFNVIRAVHEMTDSEMIVVFELESATISWTHRHRGPPAWVDCSGFLDKWNGNPYGEPFIEDGAWTVMAPRQYTDAVAMISKEASVSGIGKELDISTMKVRGHADTIGDIDPLLLTELLDPRLPWAV